MFTQSVLAGTDYYYTSNVALPNNMSWTVNTFLTTTDLAPLYNGNTPIGILSSNLQPISSITPNSINFTLNISAPASLTAQWIANSVGILERPLYLSTIFTSNTGNTIAANTQIMRVQALI